jgi:chemotaxis methyl-accepting protein methylase
MLKEGLVQILEDVYQHRDLDFRQYKESSLERRLERRLRATQAESYKQYMDVLANDPDEYTRLINSLTIQVTEFFRDPEAWQVLRKEIIPRIIEQKINNNPVNENPNHGLRIWCAGCATGEEVYSIAMLTDRLLTEKKIDLAVDIRGTDINKDALATATIAEHKLTTPRPDFQDIINEHFDSSGKFRITPRMRDCVHFESHDLVLDEPLEQMDLVICRNVAIYFTRPLQMKIFSDFARSLNEGGCLFLGKAETLIGPAKDDFEAINKRWRVLKKVSN